VIILIMKRFLLAAEMTLWGAAEFVVADTLQLLPGGLVEIGSALSVA
jgi:hypothetical protein